MKKRGFLVTIASPSGGGKSTICNAILKINQQFRYSISWTTRPIRGNEIDGQHYCFTDTDTFKHKIAEGYFIEHAIVHGNHYGTSKEFIDECINKEQIVLLDIDVQGVELIKQHGYRIVTIFILPPSIETLKQRLTDRATDTPEIIRQRLENAIKEIEYIKNYDYLVINDDLDEAIRTVNSILIAEQNRVGNYIEHISEFYSTKI